MRDDLQIETEKLTRSWAQHDSSWLNQYLVAGVEDPRLNLQSILSRHFLARALIRDRFETLIRQEYSFAAVMNWLLREADLVGDPDGRAATLHALLNNSDNAEGLEIPPFVSRAFASLPTKLEECTVPNYIEAFLKPPEARPQRPESTNPVLDTFANSWKSALECASGELPSNRQRPSLLEPACGSANDYRFLDRYGLAGFLDYTGFDLCGTNIENAQKLFPEARFQQSNVFEIPAADKSFDLCMVHDLFEHLSPGGLEQAVREVCRVTRQGICVGFFQMDEIAEHVVRPVDEYHWNLLSVARIKELFASQGFGAQAIHIGSFLAHHSGWAGFHNPNAYTFFIQRL